MVAAAVLSLAACATRSDDEPVVRIGSTSQAIINGTVSTPDQNFVVQLGMTSGGEYFGACSAIMVAKNLVLTARHCVGTFKDEASWTMVDFAPSGLEVYYGADAPKRSDFSNKQPGDAKGVKLFVPPTDQMIPDVALVLLDRPIAAAPIAKLRLDGGAKKNEMLDIVGYGIDQTSAAPLVRMQRKGVPVTGIGPLTTAKHDVFAGEFMFGEAACSGDSGGPALSATTRAVVGVASRVSNGLEPTWQNQAAFCVGAATEDVYTSLAPARDVILRAFAAAGATPLLESDPDPEPEAPARPARPSTASEEEEEREDDEPAPSKRKATNVARAGATAGCAVSHETNGSDVTSAIVALLAAASALSRRARSSRDR